MKQHISARLLIVAISLYLMPRMLQVKAAGQCGSQSSNYGGALKLHTFDKFKISSPDVCITGCQNEARCQSINYVMVESICELNNRSKETRPDDYVTDPHRIYMTVPFNRGMCSCKELRVQNISSLYRLLHISFTNCFENLLANQWYNLSVAGLFELCPALSDKSCARIPRVIHCDSSSWHVLKG